VEKGMSDLTIVPIYSKIGEKVNELIIPEKLEYIGGRVSKGEKLYYKGVGVPYKQHFVMSPGNEYEVLGQSGIFYLGYAVTKSAFTGKFGIFQEKYQPFFPDFIGACSVKERTITGNSQLFMRSSVEVVDVINYDRENKQYYFRLNYKCGRRSYLQGGNPKDLRELIEYMLNTDWNFLWDKASINDISYDGRVSDAADLFMSDELEHQLGTVYSVLYSLGKMSPDKYKEFLEFMGLKHTNDADYIFNSIQILDSNGIDTTPLVPHDKPVKNYKHTILNFLLMGKNCAYCSCDMFMDEGNMVRDQYVRTVSEQMKCL
jgi:hypothetical protein